MRTLGRSRKRGKERRGERGRVGMGGMGVCLGGGGMKKGGGVECLDQSSADRGECRRCVELCCVVLVRVVVLLLLTTL